MNAIDSVRRGARNPLQRVRATTLVCAFLFGVAVLGATADAAIETALDSGPDDQGVFAASMQETADLCALDGPEVASEPWVRTELFFGTARPDGTAVTDAQWNEFLDGEVTARFPDGLTVLTAAGQWQGDDGEIVEERSKVVILLYPSEAAAERGDRIEEIRAAYETAFQQESVLRADDSRPVCTSF
ncbi:MAG: DUF3574 domain-containing protein [Thermomicrobiales bacterium]